MTMGEKLLELRKGRGMSQEDVAEALGISRQAISRWEQNTSQPDAANLLALSDLFGVSADSLLRPERETEEDSPIHRESRDRAEREKNRAVAFAVLIGCHAVALFWEVCGWYFWKLLLVVCGGFALQILNIVGFEIIWRKYGGEEMRPWRRRYYRVVAWMISWFPAWLITGLLWREFPRPHLALWEPVSAVLLYALLSVLLSWWVRHRMK